MVPIAFNAAGASAANASIVRDTIGSEAQPLTSTVAVVSVGIAGGVLLPKLDNEEDVKAETDMNVVCTGGGRFVEVQGTAESQPSTACPNWLAVSSGTCGVPGARHAAATFQTLRPGRYQPSPPPYL